MRENEQFVSLKLSLCDRVAKVKKIFFLEDSFGISEINT